MKRFILSLVASLALTLQLTAQEAPVLVVRIDDIGCAHAANLACMEALLDGVAQSVEIMTVCTWFPEAAAMLSEHPSIDVGVHLVLSSEWDGVKWGPLTDCPSLVGEDGYFRPKVTPSKSAPFVGKSLVENGYDIAEVEKEFRAQIEMALRHLPNVTHLTGHMGSCRFDGQVSALVERLAAEYGLASIDDGGSLQRYDFYNLGYEGPHKTYREKMKSILAQVESLQDGGRYMFLDHPAYDCEEMRAYGHPGYENVASDRQGVTDMLCSRKLRRALEKRGVKLITFKELADTAE